MTKYPKKGDFLTVKKHSSLQKVCGKIEGYVVSVKFRGEPEELTLENHGSLELEITNPGKSDGYLKKGDKELFVLYNWDKSFEIIEKE